MVETLSHDLVVIGSGLAGLRAAIEAARVGGESLDVAVLSKVQVMRSHSVSAEGGTAAVLYQDEGDSFESHIYDTIKGSDFLADQDAVELFITNIPQEIYRLEHWGMPWSRREDGRIAQRPFGGLTFPRACFAEDKVGFFEMSTLYDTALKYPNIKFYEEWFATSLLVEGGEFRGVTAIELKTGNFYVVRAKAGIIATGGAGRLYGFATYGHSSTPDGYWMAYRVGIPLKDMEFVQFHPTGLVPSGILITEAARGEGGILVNKDGERFMKRYAPEKMEMAPRDIVSRAMVREIQEGRGFRGPDGLDYLHLDLTGLGADKIKTKLAGTREISMKLTGIDPIDEPLPVRPVCHYYMGGIDVDRYGATSIRGLWGAGEVTCISVNGANRLGSNSTSECLVYGRFTGRAAAEYAARNQGGKPSKELALREEKRIYDEILGGAGDENPYEIRRELQATMDRYVYVFRNAEQLTEALRKIRGLKRRSYRHVEDKSREYNTNLTNVLELEGMLEVAETIVASALARTELRGAHYRLDYPRRDDANWLRHTLIYYTVEGPRLDYSPVVITKWQPTERKY